MGWNKIQQDLFNLYLRPIDSSINICDFIDQYQDISNIWIKLSSILIEETQDKEYDKYSSIDKLEVIGNYILITTTPFTFYTIDIINKKSLNIDEVPDYIFEKVHNKNMERLPKKMFDTLKLNDNKRVINYILNNQDILTSNHDIIYRIIDNNYKTFIHFQIDRNALTIGFVSLDRGQVNYLFINNRLEPIGVSNPTGNKEELKEMCKSLNKIYIPLDIIPDYINNKTLKKNR